MPSVSTITARLTIILSLLGSVSVSAQENSPYSRYGIGDLYPSQNIVNRGFGGLTAAYSDPAGQSINFSNPASYADLKRLPGVGGVVLYDLGLSIDSRTLRSKTPIKKYSSASFFPSYISLGVPIGKGLGGALGLRPYSRINYSIIQYTRLNNIDSAQYLFEGEGGLNQAFIGLGKRWGNFSIGFNTGYIFGKKQINTRLNIINTDTAYSPFYMKSNSQTTTYFGKAFLSLGALYDVNLKSIPQQPNKLKTDYWLRLGATAMFGQKFNTRQDLLRETFEYDANGGTISIDSVYKTTGTRVKVETPSTYTFGAIFHKTLSGAGGSFDVWSFGAEYETSKWTQYRFGGLPDKLSDYWQIRIGGQWIPNTTATSLLGRSTMRLGVNYGKDYINADNNGIKTFSGTVGLGLPVRPRTAQSAQFTTINLALEVGKRGSAVNNVTESFFRISAGLSLSDIWFVKRKYD
jgi:hypothetical protein